MPSCAEGQGRHSAYVDSADLRSFIAEILDKNHYPEPVALLIADSLVDADERGVSSHGVSRLRIYLERALEGLVDPKAQPSIHGDFPAARLVDAHNAPGQVAAQAAVDEAIRVTDSMGVSVVGTANSNHCGALAYYLEQIADAGLIGIAATNAPPSMTFFGGKDRAVGTNPIGYSFPRRGGRPIILDMATSVVAKGKIIGLVQSGVDTMPEGWAVDVDGDPTTDPREALRGSVLPFGGPKGSGLAMMVELLCGVLSSSRWGEATGDLYEDRENTQGLGHFFIAIHPRAVRDDDGFDADVERFASEVERLSPAKGFDEVLTPGEIEHGYQRTARVNGVLLPATIQADLRDLADKFNVDFPRTWVLGLAE